MIGDRQMFVTPKPVLLVKRILELATDKDSLVLDGFAGSGVTGHAVLEQNTAGSGTRKFLLVEMESEVAREITAVRLQRGIGGYSYVTNKGKEVHVQGLGGGYRFCTLGEPLFDEEGHIRSGVKFPDLAAHIFFTETGSPIPKRASGKTPFLGVHHGIGVYLLFNGVLEDKRPNGGNVLTANVLRELPEHDGPQVVYGSGCRLSEARLRRCGVVFKQVPYQIAVT
jgi:adenine-specific DNA-methyltransferase